MYKHQFIRNLSVSLLFILGTLSSLAQNSKSTKLTDSPSMPVPYLCNTPLPYNPVKLDILFIGNSFSIDTSAAIPTILLGMGINNVNVYVLYKGGCSMKQHYEYFKNDEKVYGMYQYNRNGETKLETAISIREAMRRYSYDVVVFQQYSLLSGDYSTYEPYLSKVIQAYKKTTISPRTTFAFNQTWAYSKSKKEIKKYGNQKNMYESICNSIKHMREKSGIDVIIPGGTAIQNARNCKNLKTPDDFTRDGQHIDKYMGRYLLAATFFESIIAPCLSRNIRDDISVYGPSSASNQVNNSNRRLLQNCAKLAVSNNYEVSEFVDEE